MRTGIVNFGLEMYGLDLDCQADIKYHPATRATWDEPGDAAEVIEVINAWVVGFCGMKVDAVDLDVSRPVFEAITDALNINGAEDYTNA